MTSDHALLENYRNGDEGALSELLDRYQRPLYGFIYRMVGNHADTADLCQKSFFQAFRKAGTFEWRSNFKTWLYRIAVNLTRNHIRSLKRDPTVPFPNHRPLEEVPAATPATDPVVSGEEKKLLRTAIEGLPEKQRTTLMLKVYQELTFEEVAGVMGCPVGTAKANYHHALSSLRKRLKG
ncbi:MAG: sigma-70 family RNA polymerase sigma factor [Thermodesulfobacteriota bacterium]